MYLKASYSIFLIWVSTFALAQQPAIDTLLAQNSYPIHLENGKITGPGGQLLLTEADTSEILMFGENHGIVEIANFSIDLYNALSDKTPRVFVTEIGTGTAAEVEQMAKDNTLRAFLRKWTNLQSIPFFFIEEEIPLLESVKAHFSDSNESFLWGLDQEFTAGAPVVFKHLERFANTETEKRALTKAKIKSLFNPLFIGKDNGSSLQALKNAFENSDSEEAKQLTEKILLSNEIYRENSTNGKWSNEARESLMMYNFEEYIAKLRDTSKIPPMFFKFGSYHLNRGQSPTVKEALGLRIDKWAAKRNLRTLTLMVDAKQGHTLEPLRGGKAPLPSEKLWKKSIFFEKVKDTPVLFDLRPLRNHPATKNWHRRIQIMVAGYDYLVLFPLATPAKYATGTLIVYGYGFVIALFILILITLVIIGVVKRIRRWRRNRTPNV